MPRNYSDNTKIGIAVVILLIIAVCVTFVLIKKKHERDNDKNKTVKFGSFTSTSGLPWCIPTSYSIQYQRIGGGLSGPIGPKSPPTPSPPSGSPNTNPQFKVSGTVSDTKIYTIIIYRDDIIMMQQPTVVIDTVNGGWSFIDTQNPCTLPPVGPTPQFVAWTA